MRMLKVAVMCVLSAFFLLSQAAQAEEYKKWTDVTSSRIPVKIYVEKVVNATNNPKISEERSTEIVKEMFAKRIAPKFDVVLSRSEADIIFEGEVKEYIWMEKAPVTAIYGAGALAVDLATRGGKNYARKQIIYRIYTAAEKNELLEGVTLVTIKKAGMPEEKSYDMMYERGGKMLAKDIFKTGKKRSLRP